MVDKAVITYWDNLDPKNSIRKGIYLHKKGGRKRVEAFLIYGKLQELKNTYKSQFDIETLAWLINNAMCVGFYKFCEVDETRNLNCDNGDNGVYLVKDWEIVGRKYETKSFYDSFDLLEFLISIDENMPKHARLGEDYIRKNYLEPSF